MLALVESESSFGAYVCHRRPGGSIATSDLVGVCMCVCVYVCVSSWHSGWAEQMSACGYLCASWRRFLYIGLHVKPRLHAWHSHRQSRSHFAFSSLSDQWEIRLFFHFSKLFLIQNYHFLYHGDQKISWWTLQVAGSQLRNPPVKFRHERWLHLAIDLHPACPNRGRLELWPRKWFLLGQIRDAKHVERSTHYSTCRSTQVKIASTDLWPQGMFTFSEMLALVESESSFGAYVCHRRPGGSLATSDLVATGRDVTSANVDHGQCIWPVDKYNPGTQKNVRR